MVTRVKSNLIHPDPVIIKVQVTSLGDKDLTVSVKFNDSNVVTEASFSDFAMKPLHTKLLSFLDRIVQKNPEVFRGNAAMENFNFVYDVKSLFLAFPIIKKTAFLNNLTKEAKNSFSYAEKGYSTMSELIVEELLQDAQNIGKELTKLQLVSYHK